MKPIIVLGPMNSEIKLIMSSLENPVETSIGGYEMVEGTLEGQRVVAVRTKIGMVNSAVSAALAIEKYDPSCVIIQGTSGGHNPELHQKDMVIGDTLVELVNYRTAHGEVGEHTTIEESHKLGAEVLINGEVKFVMELKSDPKLVEIAKTVPYTHGKLVTGTVGSGDIWNRELQTIKYLHETLGTQCEEMEGFAVAQVCTHLQVPMLCLRVISNSEWYPEEPFDENLGSLSQEFTMNVIKALIHNEKTGL